MLERKSGPFLSNARVLRGPEMYTDYPFYVKYCLLLKNSLWRFNKNWKCCTELKNISYLRPKLHLNFCCVYFVIKFFFFLFSINSRIFKIPNMTLKGKCQEIFNNLCYQKTPPGPHINRQKQFREIFCFCEDIREKRVSA